MDDYFSVSNTFKTYGPDSFLLLLQEDNRDLIGTLTPVPAVI